MANTLVTGGAGFIGSHLVEALVQRGHKVRVLDSLIKGKLSSIKYLIDQGKVEFYEGDIRNKDNVDEAMTGIEYVFHTAGIHIEKSVKSPDDCISTNIQGSYNIFHSALTHNVKRVIFSSSSSVYGDPRKLPMHEEDQLYPAEPYGAGKLYCEHLLQHLAKKGLKYNSLRYYNVYGERQAAHAYYTTVVTHFIKRIMNNEAPIIDGKGDQSMDFCVTGDTLVQVDNFLWKPIKLMKTGDQIISFDENIKNGKRFFNKDRVKAVSSYLSRDVYELKTTQGVIRCTGNHPWLMSRGQFRRTDQIQEIQKRKNKNQRIRYFTKAPKNDLNLSAYKKGYIVGSIEGDEYFTFRRSGKSTDYRVGLEVTDKEFRDIFYDYLKDNLIGLNKKERQPKYPNSKKQYIARSLYKADFKYISKLVKSKKLKNNSWCRGYLAGMFDSEGEAGRYNLRISNKNKKIIGNIRFILKKFKFIWKEYKRKDNLIVFVIHGNLVEKVRFMTLFQPKITRKTKIMEKSEVKGSLARVLSVKSIRKQRVYNLQVEKNQTYIANGHLCHNTHVSDVVQANILAMESDAVNHEFNVGTGISTSIAQLAEIIIKALGKEIKPTFRDRTVFVTRRQADTAKAEKLLGFNAKVKVEDGIAQVAREIAAHPEKYQ